MFKGFTSQVVGYALVAGLVIFVVVPNAHVIAQAIAGVFGAVAAALPPAP